MKYTTLKLILMWGALSASHTLYSSTTPLHYLTGAACLTTGIIATMNAHACHQENNSLTTKTVDSLSWLGLKIKESAKETWRSQNNIAVTRVEKILELLEDGCLFSRFMIERHYKTVAWSALAAVLFLAAHHCVR